MTATHARASLNAQQGTAPLGTVERLGLGLLACVLVACALVFVVLSRHWPVVGDAALMHYTVFLIEHGWTPYRDFLDVNMPGAYLVTALGMHLPGSVDVSWRLFDLALLAATGAGYYAIARVYARFAALFATVLLLLVHGQDGVQQTGQRDLVIAVLLVLGVASLLEATRRDRVIYLLPFGLAAGLAATIKPTVAPLGVVLLGLVLLHRAGWWRSDEAERGSSRGGVLAWAAAGAGGLAIAPLLMVLWLWRRHALGAWLSMQRLLPYYAGLGRRPFGFTLMHSLSPLVALVVLWLVCVAAGGARWSRFERLVIATAAALNLLALLLQGKALPYQRYPMLAFLLLLVALDLATSLRARPVARIAAWAGLAIGCLLLAPLAVARVQHFVAQPQEFDSMLASDLRAANAASDGQVQCLDTIQECLPTLYSMRVQPASGMLYDVYLFGDSRDPAVQRMRAEFLQQMQARPPRAIVVVSGTFLDQSSGYAKLASWPEFHAWLTGRYAVAAERTPPHPVRWWSRPQPPPGYRLYVRQEGPPQPSR